MTTNNPITLTAGEAAELLGLAPSTLAKLRLNGNGPLYCKLGRRVVYRRQDVEVWLESRVAHNTSDADTRLPKSLTEPVVARLDVRSSSVEKIARNPSSVAGRRKHSVVSSVSADTPRREA
jgi:predicted DNA-binding transcriptional regulator AlpA